MWRPLGTAGQIRTNYAYDPFGVPLVAGDVYNPYQFTGEAWDAEVGLLYLRARYYQPETGRFISKDPWEGNQRSPATLNPYAYVADNPVNLVDPTGQTRRPPYPVAFAPYPYDVSALELGWLWLTEKCPENMVFDERWALTQYLMHDRGVNEARVQFYQRLRAGTLEDGRDYYPYRYIPIDYFREAAEYLAGHDRVGFFLGSYGVLTRLNAYDGTVTFTVLDAKDWESGSRSPCYFAPDWIAPIVNPHLPESLRLERSTHNLEELIMGSQKLDFPSDIFLASVFRPRQVGDPGMFGTGIRSGGWIWLRFTWEEPVHAHQRRRQ